MKSNQIRGLGKSRFQTPHPIAALRIVNLTRCSLKSDRANLDAPASPAYSN